MAGTHKASEHPPPVMPFDGEVDAIDPPSVEYVEPHVEGVESSVPIVDPVQPVFSPDDDPQPVPIGEAVVEPARKSTKAGK